MSSSGPRPRVSLAVDGHPQLVKLVTLLLLAFMSAVAKLYGYAGLHSDAESAIGAVLALSIFAGYVWVFQLRSLGIKPRQFGVMFVLVLLVAVLPLGPQVCIVEVVGSLLIVATAEGWARVVRVDQ